MADDDSRRGDSTVADADLLVQQDENVSHENKVNMSNTLKI